MKKYLLIIAIVVCNLESVAQFGLQRIISTKADGSQIIFAADLDGDNKKDILSANKFGDNLTWYKNIDGLGNFGPENIIANFDRATSVFAADLDGDNDSEVIATSSFLNRIVYYKNLDGHGNFGSQQIITSTAAGAFSAIATDLDNDGDLDITTASGLDSMAAWYENLDSQGNFGPIQVISSNNDNCRVIIAADIDSDGDLDIIVNGSNNITISWFENMDGLGNFGIKKIISSTAIYPNGIVCKDLDGDLDIDILFASPASNSVSWLENLDGMGNYGPEINIIDNFIDAWSVYSADIDMDGDNDILATSAEPFGGEIAWFENQDGFGNFSEKKTINTEVQSPRSVIAADIDNDGDMDVIASSQNDDKIAWYENMTILGTAENEIGNIKVYPNPTRGLVFIDSKTEIIISITIFDILGKEVYKLNEGFGQVDISNFQSGMYFFKIATDTGSFVEKIIKE